MQVPGHQRHRCRRDAGFTLLELLVTIGIVALLAALLLPTVAGSKRRAQGVVCLSNLRQLQIAWHTYVGDDGRIPANHDQPEAGQRVEYPSWVAGWLRLDNEAGSKADSTNTALLVNPKYTEFGSIGAQVENPKIYKCSLDKSIVTIDGIGIPRVRSMAMNAYLNGTSVWNDTNFTTFNRLDQMIDPSSTWVFIEEREDSINDGSFAVRMADNYVIIDVPSNYHDNGCYLSFADGHVEYKKWSERTTMPPLVPGVHSSGLPTYTSATDRDLKWLTERTSVPR